jgi:hypothetical protein
VNDEYGQSRTLATGEFSSWLDAATFVIAGRAATAARVDPAIHRLEWTLFFETDARVKPAHDESIETESAPARTFRQFRPPAPGLFQSLLEEGVVKLYDPRIEFLGAARNQLAQKSLHSG